MFRECVAVLGLLSACPLTGAEIPAPVAVGKRGTLVYQADAAGSRVPDFSHAGYGGGGVPLPVVPARVKVSPAAGDDGARIQAALDQVSGLLPDASGLRGAVQLLPGRYEIAGRLKISASGVVLRGAGDRDTVLVATGNGRRTLIELGDRPGGRKKERTIVVADDHVPVGATRLTLADAGGLMVGAVVTITRPSPASWIEAMDMADSPGRLGYGWKEGTHDVAWDRTVTAVDGRVVTLDAPLSLALDRKHDGATVTQWSESRAINRCGIENLRCVSYFDPANPFDEQHAWNAIDIHAVRDGWVADVTAEHFAGAAVQVGDQASRVTVQDCDSLAPVSELAGHRRMAFHSRGQQTLFLRCVSELGRNDFTAGHHVAGPVVFLDCEARESGGFSGSMGSWASGLLFDGVTIDGGSLRLDDLEIFNQGTGWAAANSMLWQCTASTVICRSPPEAANHAVGSWGQLAGNGAWSASHRFVKPGSLYRAQLEDRFGKPAFAALEPRGYAELPRALEEARPPEALEPLTAHPLSLVNGGLVVGGRPLSGRQIETAWWRGRLESSRAGEIGPALTRFAPGLVGQGWTDDLQELARSMRRNGEVVFRHHPGLWYDRRRDDHQMIRRADGEVWPPFYEQPFARSGQGKAWDGLSRYDLAKYNPWYFGRLSEFAGIAREQGLALVNAMYFQHNLLESGAHWVDSPWRSVNNLNGTGFTEPPPFDGDTIRMAAEFYDFTHPVRRELHRAYIRHHLDVLGAESNVIHTLAAENSGPLAFMQFWLDVVAEWKRETGKHPLIALSAPKDVQDAILADPVRSEVVDVIDLSYWFRTDQGHEFAPSGGVSLAPRQHLRQWKGGRPSAASIRSMATDLRKKHPGKAVITGLLEADDVQPAGS